MSGLCLEDVPRYVKMVFGGEVAHLIAAEPQNL